MNALNPSPNPSVNPLGDLYTRMKEMPELFRGFIESECKWSYATFYRRVKYPRLISTAEKRMLLKIARDQAIDLLKLVDRQTQTLNQASATSPVTSND